VGKANTLSRAQSSADSARDGPGGCGVSNDGDDHGVEERGEGAGGLSGRAVRGGDKSRVKGSEMMSGADMQGHKQGVEGATPDATPAASSKMRGMLMPFKDSSKQVGRCGEGGAAGGVLYPDAYFIKRPSIETCVSCVSRVCACMHV
jgi:hypothetical protein